MENVSDKYWHYEQIPDGEACNKPCPKCAKTMLTMFSSLVMTSELPQQRWYWECNDCDYQELGGIHVYERTRAPVAI